MPMSDVLIVFQWWGTLFLMGAAAYPITKHLFRGWFDRGFLFTKAVGLAVITFGVYLLGVLHVMPFTQGTVWLTMGIVFLLGIPLYIRKQEIHTWQHALLLASEELFFFGALLLWSWVKAHEPSIHNLEKYMDYGFAKSILNSRFFPAPDMWYAGLTINYYYFGHTVMAVVTRLSGIDLSYTFNLMLATIFAFCFTMSFSIGVQLLSGLKGLRRVIQISGGLFTAFLVTLSGNMQTIYAFTKGYTGDDVKPFWTLLWSLKDIGGVAGIWNGTLWGKLGEGMNTYWYANATRFIPYTIHEFPGYSFVVSDVHGHVLSIPFVLLTIALLLHMFGFAADAREKKAKRDRTEWVSLMFYGFLCGILLMTNALDGPIYLTLFLIALGVSGVAGHGSWKETAKKISLVISAAALTSLPFLLHFKSFVNGIAVNCPPGFLTDTRIGPVIFESADKCQHSPLWMWWLLWGFFVFCGSVLLLRNLWGARGFRGIRERWEHTFTSHERLLAIFFVVSVLLLIFPEFFYFKDIYPMHFRSNTMFKLGYQAFIMCSVISGYTIFRMLHHTRPNGRGRSIGRTLFFVLLVPQLFLISIYPIFSVRSYFDSLRHYEGIYGMGWFRRQYPSDWAGIAWLNSRIRGATWENTPVIVEADGDSYTDYDPVSAFTGLPTVIGWPVHEWLWRGSYDVVSPRREEVRQIYESTDVEATRKILDKYGVTYVIVGTFEREKFTNLSEQKIAGLGSPVFARGNTVIYQVH